MDKIETCQVCGSQVRLVGHTTKHYEPVATELLAEKDEIIEALASQLEEYRDACYEKDKRIKELEDVMYKNINRRYDLRKSEGELRQKIADALKVLKRIAPILQTYVHGGSLNSPYKDEVRYFSVLSAKEVLEECKSLIKTLEGGQDA